MSIINSREDLDSVKGTQRYDDFINYLKGSMTRKENVAEYPEGYGMPDYTGEVIDPVWMEVEDLTVITRYGFKKEELVD